MECIVRSFHRRKGLDHFAYLEWVTNDTFQLQRLAHEELGCGRWESGADDIPRTEMGDRLALLDVSDLEHPRLQKVSTSVDARVTPELDEDYQHEHRSVNRASSRDDSQRHHASSKRNSGYFALQLETLGRSVTPETLD